MSEPRPQPGSAARAATAEQLDVWLATQREPESARYNITVDLEFTPTVDVAALRAAFADVMVRHPGLCSRFRAANGTVERQPVAQCPPVFVTERCPGGYDRDRARQAAVAAGRAPFDLTEAPLVRAVLSRYDDGALLAVTMHHIVSDGWSTTVLAEDLVSRYRARLAGDASPPVAEDGEPSPPDLAAAESHWSAVLRDCPEPLAPIEDLLPDDELPGPSASVTVRLDEAGHRAAAELARGLGCSTAIVWSGAWSVLLRAWAGGGAGSFGMVFAGRGDGEAETVDLRSRVMPIRLAAQDDSSFAALVGRLRDQVLDSLEHSLIPADRLRRLRLDSGAAAVERAVFMHTPAYEARWTVGDTVVRRFDHPEETTKYPFSLNVLETDATTSLCVYYDSTRYSEQTAAVFAAQLGRLLTAAAADPEATSARLLTACDPEPVPEAASHGAPVTDELAIPSLVLAQAARRPEAVAVRHGEATLTYGELERRARAVVNWLHANRIREGDTVALLLEPGISVPVFWLGCALAGVVYVPLDPAYPVAQLQLIVDDAAPAVLVVADDAGVRPRSTTAPTVTVARLFAEAADCEAVPPRPTADGGDTFCVLYTSGTTGRPKGVVLPHRGLARLMRRPDFIPLDDTDVVAQLCPLNFDGASYEIWGALAHGGELVVLDKALVLDPRELREVVRRRGVTTLLVTTPLLNRIIEDAPELLQSLRRVYFGGELISVPHMRRALRWCRPGVLLHSYGPTENSFTSTWCPITEIPPRVRTLPIGEPVPGTRVRVLLDGGATAPRGVPGELLLGGVGLADGYLNDPEHSARRFVPDPYAPGERLYRTGDRVRWDPAGRLEFIGRDDNQVKIRSQRVELGEVEAVLDAHPEVAAVFVTVRRNGRGEKEIVAYVVTDGEVTRLREHARSRLPSFAVPTHFVAMPELPMTPTGKIDRRGLPEPEEAGEPIVAAVADGPFSAVRTAWRQVLEHNGFGDEQNFFDAGGHSLLIVRLQERLRAATGVAVSVVDLMRHTTVRAQAELTGVKRAESVDGRQRVVSATGSCDGRRTATASAPTSSAPRPAVTVSLRRDESADSRRHQILALSTLTAPALSAARDRLARHLDAHRPALDDVAHTLDVGREHFGHRLAVVAADIDAAKRALTEDSAEVHRGDADRRRAPSVVVGFTALDVATVGADACRLFPLVKARVDEAAALTGAAEPWRQPDASLRLAVQFGLFEQLCDWNITPAGVTATGDGRLTAAVAAGALSFADGVATAIRPADDREPVDTALPVLPWPTDAGSRRPGEATATSGSDDTVVLGIGSIPDDAVDIPALLPGTPDDLALLSAAARLWCLGVPVRLSPNGRGRRVRLPVHPLSWE